MSKIRHWKQRWSATAPLIFAKKLRIGDGYVLPGEPVTQEHRDHLGLHRLRRWWEAGVIALAGKYPKVKSLGNGWSEVIMGPGARAQRVHGKEALEDLLG